MERSGDQQIVGLSIATSVRYRLFHAFGDPVQTSVLSDTDVIIWEGDPADPTRKPPEMYTLVENFCLGMRRLEIFGKLSSLRRGWVTVFAPGQEDHLSHAVDRSGNVPVDTVGEDGVETRMVARRWTQGSWEEGIKSLAGGNKPVVPMTPEIETLRPKSPVRPGQPGPGGGATQSASGAIGMSGVASMSMPVRMPVTMSTPARFSASNNQVIAAQNQMMMQPMMSMNMAPMGMGMDDMMGNWNPMMSNMAMMGGINMGTPQAGGMGGNRAMPNTLGMMGVGAPGMTMQMMNQMGQMGMGHIQGMQGGGGFIGGMGGPAAWGEQGGWDTGQMNGMNMGNMGMGMGQPWAHF